jgi:hypothetical protein
VLHFGLDVAERGILSQILSKKAARGPLEEKFGRIGMNIVDE